jgi:predicted ATPase
MSETPAEDGAATGAVPFISRLRLKNYKSIAQCDVRLGPLTILVGPNGSGKSNFLDALEFLCRAVATSPNSAAVLAALFQPESLDGRLPLIGIEEPEIALHPAAAGVLFDALTEASEHVQVIATSQSADLLDREDLDPAVIRPVTMRDGLTIIGEVDDASQEIVKQKLYTLGELMRGDQLSPQLSQEATPDA